MSWEDLPRQAPCVTGEETEARRSRKVSWPRSPHWGNSMIAAGGQKNDVVGMDHFLLPVATKLTLIATFSFLDFCSASPQPVLPIEARVIFQS